MTITIQKSSILSSYSSITITGSKSESNRTLILKALYPNIDIENLSNSDDTQVMQRALVSEDTFVDIHHAGTAMRFLTAFFAMQEGREVVLSGSARMKERPIKVLVDALLDLGADISYIETEGCPPLRIKGKTLSKNRVILKANVSSQYISALLLMAPKLKNGLELTLEGDITSVPYINMTLELLNQIGVDTSFDGNIITVHHTSEIANKKIVIESDWSSASYYYSIVALSAVGTELELHSYKSNSLQGDAVLADIYIDFGIKTSFKENSISIKKVKECQLNTVNYQLNNSPDIAQTIAVTCFAMGMSCHLSGLHTLKIKETDRISALKTELEKLGAMIEVTEDSLRLISSNSIKRNVTISTYNDHRMAMAFAPLALKTDLKIEDAMVVSKSYPTFWEDLKSIGFKITE